MTIAVDAETERFARQLAEIRGETIEQAVSAAVRAELARVERPASVTLTPDQAALVERTMAMLATLPRVAVEPGDPTDFLYDEHGLPRWAVVIDSSAIIAILHGEPEAYDFTVRPAGAVIRRISAATYLEAGMVLIRRDPTGTTRAAMDTLIADAGIVIEPVTAGQARAALDAFGRFGKGTGHPARLNYGDCFSYALAIERGEPLLFKGRDFSHTDLVSAV